MILQTDDSSQTKSISYSDDYFNQATRVQYLVSRFIKTKYNVYLSGIDQEYIHMFVADIDENVLDFRRVEFPFEILKDSSLTVVESEERRVLLTASLPGEGWGTLLVSNSRGWLFETSLPFVVLNSHGYSDVQRVRGLRHVYLANQLTESSQNTVRQGLPPGTSISDLTVLTKRSMDHGNSWQLLSPPPNEECLSNQCFLHLQSLSSHSDATSNPNAPGILVATGNVGKYLRSDPVNTYLSKNAGHTWVLVHHGDYRAEISEQGGLIILGRNDGPTVELLMSWDVGRTFTRTEFSTVEVFISSLHTDPEKQGTIFIVSGLLKGSPKGYIASIDFSLLFKRVCDSQDYEEWFMEGQSHKCVDGRILSFWRRKSGSHCFSDDSSDMIKLEQLCSCGKEDWECEAGNEGTGCVQTQVMPAPCNGSYLSSSGYQRRKDSFCENGLQLGPEIASCPTFFLREYLLLIVVFGSVAAFICFRFVRRPVKYRID